MHKLIFEAFKDVRKADIVLCNTVQELELDTISTLQTLIPFYAIGPTLQFESPKDVVSASLWPESNCLEWLSTKPNNSVLYVSFGSLANLNKSDIMEVAYGLMESNVNFIWVLRLGIVLGDDNHDNMLPNGFEDMVRGRGVIVGWTNQISILSHSAIGGFLTHCGWNSVLESIWYSVPMLCFPVFTDQFTNRKLVVDDWKVGVNLCDGKQLNRREIGENVKNFMVEHKSGEFRKNIDFVRKMLVNALGDEGSSSKNMNLFVEKLVA